MDARSFNFAFESGERVVPELVEPAPQSAQALGIDAVHAARTVRTVCHESRFFQRLEMLRNRRATDRQSGGEYRDGFGAGAKSFEHATASGVAQALQGISVTHALR